MIASGGVSPVWVIFTTDKAYGSQLMSPNGGFMFDGVFQAFHLIILLVMVMIVAVGMFPVFRALWHHGSRNSNRLRRGIHVTQ